ncbi:hypothetical protein GIB67_014444 [Kingdonia uniflora]|uniref:COBRA C-terminal domain-containing protein n=1 Tax=Kingdonia uniflora TaxID=39325 RepID=A0A7J7LZ74_9MAGN|nr:hypothetical protein GIB67_014444 [Kingdonia uniflora]
MQAEVSILNKQLFRHVEVPGWKLKWDWSGDEVIWSMVGAEALQQGNCTRIKSKVLPHSCKKSPEIVDLLLGAPFNLQTTNCCKAGVLSSMKQDPTKYGATFRMSVGKSYTGSNIGYLIPKNFNLGLPGYSCGVPHEVQPSRFRSGNGRRWTEALMSWNVTCTYSQFAASTSPKCCVSMSAFYNETIVPCPWCSCGCQGSQGTQCVKDDKASSLLKLHGEEEGVTSALRCTIHMCPIRVHWHVKVSYKDYWRVRMTVNNFNYAKNYSQWSLVVQHPNLRSLVQTYSFNYIPLNQYGPINDTGMFWGIQYYNDMLLQSGDKGNVQTELLFHKDSDMFTFSNGWAFPRKISFNGDECVMPSPDEYPRLPNGSRSPHPIVRPYMYLLLSFLTLILLIQ